MSEPICKVADIIFVRFELVDLKPQKEYMEHFGMLLAYETEDTIFYLGANSWDQIQNFVQKKIDYWKWC